jgi:lipopolysaccharide transport system ATP-binding protein
VSNVAVRAEHLSKRYLIGERSAGYRMFRETLSDFVGGILRRNERAPRQEHWALRDVSFDLHWGDVLGVIGPNGAGKSTLLKILSRITEPTGGQAEVYGRVGSLLEVGIGFHPELTGRENIYLSGAVLGMSRNDIRRRFDEIVSFANLEEFLDTPAKYYSSGMYTRLGFSVAAHLEPDVLIVDEVLSVGDAAFQRKSIAKISDTAREGRTVLYVSHNMGSVETLCTTCLLLNDGHAVALGDPTEMIGRYFLENGEDETEAGCLTVNPDYLDREDTSFVLKSFRALNDQDSAKAITRSNESLRIRAEFCCLEPMTDVAFSLRVLSRSGTELVRLSTEPISGFEIEYLPAGEGAIELQLGQLPLTAGDYLIDFSIGRPQEKPIADFSRVAVLTITATDVYGGNVLMDTSRGYLVVPHEWRLDPPTA